VKRAAHIALGLILGIGLSISPVEGQSVTGPEMSRKSASVPAVGQPHPPAADLDWLSWGETAAVTELVHEPIKLMGMGRFRPDSGLALKGLIGQAEERIRGTLRAFSAGEVESAQARRSMEEAVAEYRAGVVALLDAR